MSDLTVARLDAIYAQLPTIACQRKCVACCGPVAVWPTERQRLEAATGRRFDVTLEQQCSYLDRINGLCTAYAVRPLICRVWGTMQRMACPHGCTPSRQLSHEEFMGIAAELTQLDGAAQLPEGFLAQLWTLERQYSPKT